MPRHPAFSIVINTDNRARSLAKTLESLRHLDYPDFEVCVVRGPTPDPTSEVLEPWHGKIKLAQCSVRNLAVSRNIGIAMSAGEIVAFIDDDAVPEPEWLRDLAATYETSDIDAAGGFVHDHTGVSFQWRYGTSNRLGESKLDWSHATPELNVPGTPSFPALLGTNCSFRRQTLLELGGFDEEYEYFLEETDLCCRLVDSGGKIAQVAGAYVHHQLRPGGGRTRRRSLRDWYPTIKNKIYFSLVNGGTQHDMATIVRAADWFVRFHRGVLEQDIAEGELGEADRARFNADAARAWGDGLTRGLAGDRRLLRSETLHHFAQPFLAYTAPVPTGGRKTFCFLTQHYPPGSMAGVARSIPPLARAIAALGHHAHVLTQGADQDLVDFEGIWVHRIVPRQTRPQALGKEIFVPQRIWNHAAAMLAEVERIAARRPVECVYAPLWDCEGAAIQLDGRFPLAVELHTPMQTVLATQPRLQTDAAYVASIAEPIMAVERQILLSAARLRSNSNAITQEIERGYGVSLGERVTLIPHASEDWTACPCVAPADLPPDSLRLLFVGRLEPRKGIDVLLETARRLLAHFPRVHLDVVGDDALSGPDGRSYRKVFETDPASDAIGDRVHFHGEVSEEALRGFYRACDVFVAPSRFESFGLILLEAMMFARPVVCCRTGGMPEVVVEGETALLAEPGDAVSLERCLSRLIEDPALRLRLGTAGRHRYEAHCTPERTASEVAAFLCETATAHRAGKTLLQRTAEE